VYRRLAQPPSALRFEAALAVKKPTLIIGPAIKYGKF
jgi:hypothetical protein